MNEVIKVIIGNSVYGGWTTLMITKSISSLCGLFEFSLSGLSLASFSKIFMGDKVYIYVNDICIFLGFIEQINDTGSSKQHTLNMKGRSLLCDLVDCSYDGEKGEWLDISLLDAVKKLTKKFEQVEVATLTADADYYSTYKKYNFPQVKTQEGDVIFNLIQKLCRMRSVIPMGGIFDEDLNTETLSITTVSKNKVSDALVSGSSASYAKIGHTIKSWRISESNQNRFSFYKVKGQASNLDAVNSSDGFEAGGLTAPFGAAEDSAITRHRPTVIISDSPGNAKDMENRAKWESMIRAGDSRKVSYVVRGWTQKDGEPWDINRIIHVHDEIGGVIADLLIDKVKFNFDVKTGANTTLDLVHPAKYSMPTPDLQAGNIKGGHDINTPEPKKS